MSDGERAKFETIKALMGLGMGEGFSFAEVKELQRMCRKTSNSRKHLSAMGLMRGLKPCRWYMSKKKYRAKIMDILQRRTSKNYGL